MRVEGRYTMMQLRFRDAEKAVAERQPCDVEAFASPDIVSEDSDEEYRGELNDLLGKKPVHWK